MPTKSSKSGPRILEMPPQKMAVVKGKGAPDKVFAELMPALYGSVYTLKFDRKKKGLPEYKVGASRARYPNANTAAKDSWVIELGIPVPDDVTALPQKVPGVEVKLEVWQYGSVGEILHIGPYDQETPSIQALVKFIEENGYEISGAHEEEYLTRPDAKVMKTLIRYPVKRKA